MVPSFQFEVDPSVPIVPPPPTFYESLATKPRCQLSARLTYGEAFQPLVESGFYRRLYYQLLKNVDQEMFRVFTALRDSSFYENTIVIFTSDHGELLGAHGGLTQKWYCAYEEAIHVPLIVHNPVLFEQPATIDLLTSHVDILPTLLGLAGENTRQLQEILRLDHSEVRPLVGRDLSGLLLGKDWPARADEPLYFMTDDDITKGLNQDNFLGWHYDSVAQPNHVETVIARLAGGEGGEIWKYSRYFDNPRFRTKPAWFITAAERVPVPDQYELYNLSRDPLETDNLADCCRDDAGLLPLQQKLAGLLLAQRRQKRLSPTFRPTRFTACPGIR